MPLTLAGGATVALDTTFQARVALAFYFVAREVLNENKSVTGNEVRVRFARAVISQEFSQYQKLAALVVTDSAIIQLLPATSPSQAAIPDDLIITAVRNAWSRLAGVEA